MSSDRVDLREATLRGVRWISGARLVAELTVFASVVVLARLIPPAEFGRAAIALSVVAVAAVLGPAGMTAVVVQRRELGRDEIESATFLSLVLGVAAAALVFVFATSGAAGALFGVQTAELLVLASPAFLLAGAGGVAQALVQRELRFGRIAVIDGLPIFLGAVTSVTLALLGVEGAALVAGALVLLGCATVLALTAVPFVVPRPSLVAIRGLAGFSAPATLSSLAYLGFRNVDYVILGARMAPADVGYYWRAYQLGAEYQSKISQVMLRVSFPVYSRAADLDELKRLRARIVRMHATVIVPLLAGFVAVAPVLIPALFGQAWEPAVVPAQIMAITGMTDALLTGLGPLMVAIGRPGRLLALNVGELATYATMIFFLAPYGLVTVSIGVACYGIVNLLFIQTILMPRVIGLGFLDFVRDVRAGVVTAAAVLPVLVGSRILLDDLGLATVPLLAVVAVVGAGVYGLVLRAAFGDAWSDLVLVFARVLGRKGVASGSAARA